MNKRSLLSAAFVLICGAARAECPPVSIRSNDSAAVETLYCEIDKLAEAIARQERTIPKILYHFTKQEYADENARLGTIDSDTWNDKIMGSASRFALSSLRKGLYGTTSIETNFFGTSEYPALMEIRIKDECRRPERTASLASLEQDARFQSYLTTHLEHRMSLSRFKTACVVEDMDFTFNQMPEDCRVAIEGFFKAQKISIVQDTFVNQSFYIRDRECIEGIRGTVQDQIRILGEGEINWVPRCKGDLQTSNNLARLLIRLTSQSIARNVTPAFDRERILKNAMKLDDSVPAAVADFLDQIRECEKTGNLQEFRKLLVETVKKSPFIQIWELSDIRCPQKE